MATASSIGNPIGRFRRGFSSVVQSLRGLPIAYKLAMAVSLLLLLGVGLLMSIVLRYQDQLLSEQIDTYGGIIASQFAASVTEPLFTDDTMSMQVLAVNLVNDQRVQGAAIVNDKGKVVTQTGQIPALQFQVKTGVSSLSIPTSDSQQGIIYAHPVRFHEVTAGWIVVNFTPLEVNQNFQRMIKATVTVTLLMLVLVMLFAYGMSKRMARPIETLVAATESIGAGRYDVALPVRSNDEIGRVFKAMNRMAADLDEKHRMRGVLSRVVATDIAETLMQESLMQESDSEGLNSTRVEASVLFVDIVGFTSLAEQQPAEQVVKLLNEYFSYFTLCSQLFFGSVDKFIGDCAMVIFGAPRPNEDHRFNAVACAVVIQRLLAHLNQQRQAQGLAEIKVRIGINSGEMMAGTVGTAQRMEYTVVGDAVNLASRLTDMAAPDDILVGEASLQHASIGNRIEAEQHSTVTVKGKQEPVASYRVKGISKEYLQVMDNLIEDIVSRYSVEEKA
jgi:adenylate cyclase